MKTIDARGQICPKPLIMTKKALKNARQNESLQIILDNETAVQNVTRFLQDNGQEVSVHKKDHLHYIAVNAKEELPDGIEAEAYCDTGTTKNESPVMLFKQNKMGHGPEALGTILMTAFINTLPEITLKPQKLIFVNSGIFLTLTDSDTLEALKTLEKSGTDILVCGTCLDFFNKKNQLAVGKVSNMHDILEYLTLAAKVIYP